jgi:hypothetical protein
MTPAEHRRLAEEWLAEADRQKTNFAEAEDTRLERMRDAISRAQVHATLAQEPMKAPTATARSWGW